VNNHLGALAITKMHIRKFMPVYLDRNKEQVVKVSW